LTTDLNKNKVSELIGGEVLHQFNELSCVLSIYE